MFNDDTQKPGSAPANLPIGDSEPMDILPADKDEAPLQPLPEVPMPSRANSDFSSGGVQFKDGKLGNGPSALDAGKLKPIPPATPSMRPVASVTVKPAMVSGSMLGGNPVEIHESFIVRYKILIIGVVGLIIVIPLVWAGISLYTRGNQLVETTAILKDDVVAPPSEDPATEPVLSVVTPVSETPIATSTIGNGDTSSSISEVVEQKPSENDATKDTDGDGLTNSEEITAGTDPAKADTDVDGLTDKEEINLWKTDPRNPDTDKDGFKDGAEVKNGYNPLGTGRLFGVPKK